MRIGIGISIANPPRPAPVEEAILDESGVAILDESGSPLEPDA